MNCACNRYKTCIECRNAYKESVKRERQLTDAIIELERKSNHYNISDGNYFEGLKDGYDEAIAILKMGIKIK